MSGASDENDPPTQFYVVLGQEIEELVKQRCETAGYPPEDGVRATLAAASVIALQFDELKTFIEVAEKLTREMEKLVHPGARRTH